MLTRYQKYNPFLKLDQAITYLSHVCLYVKHFASIEWFLMSDACRDSKFQHLDYLPLSRALGAVWRLEDHSCGAEAASCGNYSKIAAGGGHHAFSEVGSWSSFNSYSDDGFDTKLEDSRGDQHGGKGLYLLCELVDKDTACKLYDKSESPPQETNSMGPQRPELYFMVTHLKVNNRIARSWICNDSLALGGWALCD